MEVKLPAKLEYLSLLRLVVSAVCRQVPLEDEAIDDLKIAVTEVCSRAIENKLTDNLIMKLYPNKQEVRVSLGPFLHFYPEKLFVSEFFNFNVFKSLLDRFEVEHKNKFYQVVLVKKIGD